MSGVVGTSAFTVRRGATELPGQGRAQTEFGHEGNAIEARTGLDFLLKLPEADQAVVESAKATAFWECVETTERIAN